MIELREFQRTASDQIAARFRRYYDDPPWRGTQKNRRVVPFFQELASITASGKTVILADAVQTMAASVPIDPVVLWLSKGKVVVEQSFKNLADGGKYHHLLGAAEVDFLARYDADLVTDASRPCIFFATVGTFNQKDREEGTRLIFKSEIDTAESSTWDALKRRSNQLGERRPLFVVYDEGHNLTDQQTELILELQPDALLSASATTRLPQQIAKEVKYLQDEGWKNEELITTVDARDVADSGLVKSTVVVGGFEAPMEETLDSLLEDMADAEALARSWDAELPKAIYVSKTNIVEGNSFQRDDPKQPFETRKAPPILIWRYLVEQHGVDPNDIAVYCALKLDKSYPPPEDFHLFKGGDKDYDAFVAGSYRHIIFNQALQEGWDDPACYFAYIDKSMESNVQVEQVIGRLLRQPGGEHLPVERLNTAHFYIRVDKRSVFTSLVSEVNKRLTADAPFIRVIETAPGKPKPTPIPPQVKAEIYETAYMTEQAVEPVQQLVSSLADFSQDDGSNIKSSGGRTLIEKRIGDASSNDFEWQEFEHTNMVSARWLFQREVSRLFPGALGLAPTDEKKFDALIGFNSVAHKHIASVAQSVVEQYIDNVYLKQKRVDPYEVGPVLVRTEDAMEFRNAVHSSYSDLNIMEENFAKALDSKELRWCRNPARSGYTIPLITLGKTRNFYPDFLIWSEDDVIAVDTSGAHLLTDKVGRKLLSIVPPKNSSGRLIVCFVSDGKWNSNMQPIDSSSGFTIWSMKQDSTLRATTVDSIEDAVTKVIAMSASAR